MTFQVFKQESAKRMKEERQQHSNIKMSGEDEEPSKMVVGRITSPPKISAS